MSKDKLTEIVISYVKTFIATFFSVLGTLVMSVDFSVFLNSDAWKTGLVASIIVATVRSGLSETWKKTPFIPKKLGGLK
jgi:hypothetical protein